jgi:hypothetical protein
MRNGRFKKAHIPQETLKNIGENVFSKINPYFQQYDQGIISAPEVSLIYLMAYLTELHPKTFLGSKINQIKSQGDFFDQIPWIQNQSLKAYSFQSFLNSFSLRGVPLSVNQTLLKWHEGLYPLEILDYVPYPDELFHFQKSGKRVLTLFRTKKQLSEYILEERDPFSFAVHDLEHAHEFFARPNVYLGQIGFYHLIEPFLSNSIVKQARKNNEQFKYEFEYAIADMNAYCVHLLKYFASAFHQLEQTETQYQGLFLDLILSIKPSIEIKNLIIKIYNQEKISDNETIILERFIHDQNHFQSSDSLNFSLDRSNSIT